MMKNRFDEPLACTCTRTNNEGGSGGSNNTDTQSNKADQAQDTTVDQDSGDVTIWVDDSEVSIGSINTGNSANVSASQSADQ
jgi:hypothetical protein